MMTRIHGFGAALLTFGCGLLLAVSESDASNLTRAGAPQREGRLATPGGLRCPRDNTTSFTGRVLAFDRGRNKVFIRVRTDEETTEQFTLVNGRRGDPTRLFRLRGGPFGSADWRKIETRRGRLRPNMRATVWACYEGENPKAELIDWMPPED